MTKSTKLTEGNITKSIIKLAIPIMGTSFIQMAYNMIDMIWIGRVSSDAVAAIGTAGFFTWFGMSLILIPKTGAEIGVAQSTGSDNHNATKLFIKNTIQIDIILAILYGLFIFIFRNQLIGFFKLGNDAVNKMAIDYLLIIIIGFPFYFISPVLTGIFNGSGDSKTPFRINTLGLVINIILDPILILGFGPIPALGVKGAAIATILAQFFVSLCFFITIKSQLILFFNIHIFEKLDIDYIKKIFKLGFPSSIQNGAFAFFAMLIARLIADWGTLPIAVQKVGSQIEAISWMSASGFATAVCAFIGQNYGGKKWDRIRKGYFISLGLVSIIGIGATFILIVFSKPIFSIFIPEKEAISYGVVYLKILGISQLFMCVEIISAGAFNGLGKTLPPAIIGILLTGSRIPLSLILAYKFNLGLNGIWWSISITSIFKGIILTSWFLIKLRSIPKIPIEPYTKL